MVGYRNVVEVDASGHIQLTWLQDYENSVGGHTWAATMNYVKSLKQHTTKIAFFNSTPQGGGVALMRHALIRFFRSVGVDCQWYVPKPKPEVFRITKTNHNILQGVADPRENLTERQKLLLQEWCDQNARRFWTSEGGPLRPRKEGGADVVIVDDPQMPGLVPLAKKMDPTRPVIFRSHIQVRADLADKGANPTADVWNWLWNQVKGADLFIAHPVREFVPATVPVEKVGYMPAATDWLDGLNKDMHTYDLQYYLHEFNTECFKQHMDRILFPSRDYIVQIARFDPSKGIPHVLESYATLRRKYLKDASVKDIPQLVIAGHGAVDDPDASLIYDQTMEAIEQKYSDIRSDIVVMRVGPTDQVLNAIMSNAKIALQLSTREGFEVKVSEALHKGIPIIATKAGGIPLQVHHGKSGYLVEPGDAEAVARYLHYLLVNEDAYREMSWYAANHVSDEVSTVGNALCWVYLADELAKGEKILPNSRWINDMAREKAGEPYVEGEPRLPRNPGLDLNSPVTGRDEE
jgi:alpha,alpha-trehalose phosphorylase (configuration-retaining)